MSLPRELAQRPDINHWAIILGYRGSIAHGTYLKPEDPHSIDDKDAMGFVVPPNDHYYGLKEFGSRGTREIMSDPWDIVLYEARKAISLLKKANPNTLSLLWLPQNLYMKVTPAGQHLIDNRDAFVSVKAFHPFVGYARGQLHKMTHGEYRGYMGDKRRELVEKYGFDTKNGAHLVRILRQGVEFLREGELHVQRPDAQELLGIRRGDWSLERVQGEADRLFKLAEDAYLHSSLPKDIDRERINNLCVEVVQSALSDRLA